MPDRSTPNRPSHRAPAAALTTAGRRLLLAGLLAGTLLAAPDVSTGAATPRAVLQPDGAWFSTGVSPSYMHAPTINESHAQSIEFTMIDPEAVLHGTYSSHNQKVVSNKYGIFMTHLHAIDASQNATWRLSRSNDGGETFSTIYEASSQTVVPALDTDSSGNLYLVHSDYSSRNAYFYRFPSSRDFQDPTISLIPNNGIVGKFAMKVDESR